MAWHNRADNEWTLRLLQVEDAERVLEVGFGPGRAIAMLAAARPSARIAGIDHSETMLASATRANRSAIAAGRVSLRHGSVEDLPHPDDAFDKAYSIHCIYFWRDPLHGLSELRRVLRPGGRLAITVRDRARAAYEPFRAENLAQLLTQARFSSVNVHRNANASHPLICAVGVK